MKFVSTVRAVALALTAVAGSAAQAAAVTYFAANPSAANTVSNGMTAGQDPVTQRNLFVGSLSSSQTEAFNMTGGSTSSLSNIFAAGSGVTLTSTGITNTISRVQYNPQPASSLTGRFNTTGDPAAAVTSAGASGWFETNKDTTVVQFTTAVSAFGTFITDVSDFRGTLDVAIYNGATLVASRNLISAGTTGLANGGLAFFGYTNDSTSFTRIVFSLSQASGLLPGGYDFIGFDDFITGPLNTNGGSTPEPSSLALAALSVGLLAASRRARQER